MLQIGCFLLLQDDILIYNGLVWFQPWIICLEQDAACMLPVNTFDFAWPDS
jgi:hypothetical protein